MNIRKWQREFSKDLKLIYNSEATRRNYISHVTKFLHRFKDCTEPKAIPNQAIKDYLLEANTHNTRKSRLCALNAFYKNTVKMPKKVAQIPYPRKQHTLPVVLSIEEVQILFDVCSNLKHKVILSLLYGCGLRRSELVKLKWEHIDRSRNIINIVAAKGCKDRQVTLAPELITLLEQYWKRYRSKVYVLNGQSHLKYTGSSILKVVKQLAKQSQIKKPITAHTLRHCYATHLLEGGTDIALIQKLLGHNSPKTTAIYTHISHNLISRIKTPLSNIA